LFAIQEKEAKAAKALKSSSGVQNESDNNSNKELPVLSNLSSSRALPPIGQPVSKSENYDSDEKTSNATPRPIQSSASMEMESTTRNADLFLEKGFGRVDRFEKRSPSADSLLHRHENIERDLALIGFSAFVRRNEVFSIR
jgi:hypothetical protein